MIASRYFSSVGQEQMSSAVQAVSEHVGSASDAVQATCSACCYQNGTTVGAAAAAAAAGQDAGCVAGQYEAGCHFTT
jgi:hypothetical protein